MKYKQTGNCPYCDAERGVQTMWGMGPQGWANLKERHDAGHPENEAKEQGECPRCHKGKLVKGICSYCGWIQGQISPIAKPKKEQGEKKHKEAVTNGPPYCVNCGQLLTIAEMDRDCPTPPLKEDRKEIEKLDFFYDSLRPEGENNYKWLCLIERKINEIINHLSSKEK